jgi:hypothetical protein
MLTIPTNTRNVAQRCDRQKRFLPAAPMAPGEPLPVVEFRAKLPLPQRTLSPPIAAKASPGTKSAISLPAISQLSRPHKEFRQGHLACTVSRLAAVLAGTARFPASGSGEVHRETFEIGERAVAEGTFVSSPQYHTGRLARLKCFPPTRCTQTPPIAGPQTGKAEFWHRCRKIITAGFRKFEKRGGHDGADGVTPDVLSAGVAAAVSKKSRHGFQRADFQPVTEDIPGCVRPTAAIPAIIPQHLSLPCRCPRTPATDGGQGLRARRNRAQRGSCTLTPLDHRENLAFRCGL